MNEKVLGEKLAEAAGRLAVPGVAVGVYHDGTEQYAFHGVTSLENPLPVDETTLFQFGSTGKTYTATAIMRLVERGEVELEAPVRRYVPELALKDEETARSVTVLHLLNHTAGWAGDALDNTGDGDDAIARFVERMARLEQVTPLGTAASYNNASLSLAGRIIEKITGTTYEKAIKELLFEPLGLEHSFFFMTEIMTRRFAVGHTQHPDGRITVARPWALPRSGAPAGGISSNSGDLIRWARFHLGDGRAHDGTRVLSEDLLKLMQAPTFEMPGSAIGDAVGISWLLHDVDGVRVVSHGGTTNGQHSELIMVPERDFAISVLTNCGPNGAELYRELTKWALEEHVGIRETEPEPIVLSHTELVAYTGRYETIAAVCDITAENSGLVAKVEIKPEVLAQLREELDDEPEEQDPYPLALLAGTGDRYVVSGGPAKGMKGYFVRGPSGEIEGVHLGGRLATRTGAVPQVAVTS